MWAWASTEKNSKQTHYIKSGFLSTKTEIVFSCKTYSNNLRESIGEQMM